MKYIFHFLVKRKPVRKEETEVAGFSTESGQEQINIIKSGKQCHGLAARGRCTLQNRRGRYAKRDEEKVMHQMEFQRKRKTSSDFEEDDYALTIML